MNNLLSDKVFIERIDTRHSFNGVITIGVRYETDCDVMLRRLYVGINEQCLGDPHIKIPLRRQIRTRQLSDDLKHKIYNIAYPGATYYE